VAADQRGRGLGRRMLTHLLARPALAGIDILETTVTPSNRASRRMFEAFAAARGGTLSEAPLFDAHHFGGEGHEEEVLLHIRGLAGRNNQTEE
jgi:L-2,4-diaminobutyric acid acetyltransferase